MVCWLYAVPWLERRNLAIRYVVDVPSSFATVTVSAETSCTTPGFSARTTSPLSSAARNSMPVPTSGASARTSGTAWRCMFEPINARLASSCSRNGIIAVAAETIWRAETSMKSTSTAGRYSTSPPLVRTRTRSSAKWPSAVSGALACAMTCSSSSSAVR